MTVEHMTNAIKILSRRVSELEQFDPTSATAEDIAGMLGSAVEETLARVFGKDTDDYYRYLGAARLDNGPITMIGPRGAPRRETLRYLTEGKASAMQTLNGAI